MNRETRKAKHVIRYALNQLPSTALQRIIDYIDSGEHLITDGAIVSFDVHGNIRDL